MNSPPLTIAELTARYRKLERALELLPETPSREGAAAVFKYADQAQQLAEQMREMLGACPPNFTEAELDELHAAMSDASGVLQRRFAGFVPPRIS